MQGKTVLVTGATRGIGKAIALKFASEGANIAINYRNEEPTELLCLLESHKDILVKAFKADISDFKQSETLIKTIKKEMGSIDVLINNAGITKDNLLIRMTEEEFDSVINTNLKGTFNTTKHVANVMLKQKSGSIINLTSVVGLIGNIGQTNYAASKAGIIGLTKSTARELASRGITCNAIAPGFVSTKMTDSLSDDIKTKMLENIPLNRFGTVDEVAEAAYFLATNKYITGQVLSVNGGMFM